MDVGKHQSKEEPPRGPVFGDQKPKNSKKGTNSVDAMTSAFTHMANTLATALSPPEKAQTPTEPPLTYHIQKLEFHQAEGLSFRRNF